MNYVQTCFFFFNDTATTEIYTLSLHDALPIFTVRLQHELGVRVRHAEAGRRRRSPEHVVPQEVPVEREPFAQRRDRDLDRSEEHTSELQSRQYLVCRLLLEKKNLPSHQRPPLL